MGAKKPVVLSTREFTKQGDADRYFSTMLRSYQIGQRISLEDTADLIALLDRHPEAIEKIGKGVAYFDIMRSDQGTPCFRINRVDNTGTDFSLYWAIRARPPSRKQEVMAALRRVIADDINQARARMAASSRLADGRVLCAATQTAIDLVDAHVDHVPPITFELIVVEFLALHGATFDAVPITIGTDNQTAPDITDATFASAFRTYHLGRAELALIHRTVNLAQSSKYRLRSG
jgi:hypothetical protein